MVGHARPHPRVRARPHRQPQRAPAYHAAAALGMAASTGKSVCLWDLLLLRRALGASARRSSFVYSPHSQLRPPRAHPQRRWKYASQKASLSSACQRGSAACSDVSPRRTSPMAYSRSTPSGTGGTGTPPAERCHPLWPLDGPGTRMSGGHGYPAGLAPRLRRGAVGGGRIRSRQLRPFSGEALGEEIGEALGEERRGREAARERCGYGRRGGGFL